MEARVGIEGGPQVERAGLRVAGSIGLEISAQTEPFASVVSVRVALAAVLVTVTAQSATTAPEVSFTVPMNDPNVDCARRLPQTTTDKAQVAKSRLGLVSAPNTVQAWSLPVRQCPIRLRMRYCGLPSYVIFFLSFDGRFGVTK